MSESSESKDQLIQEVIRLHTEFDNQEPSERDLEYFNSLQVHELEYLIALHS